MSHLISQRCYTDGDVYQREIAAMRTSWHFAGLGRDLRDHDDWIMVRVADREVVIQNFHGELRGFTNTCSHRFNAIRSAPSGSGALMCPYHRWTFDQDGCPSGIPFRAQSSTIDLSRLRLERWRVETRGDFVFVRRATDHEEPLSTWLGGLGPRLEEISSWMGEPYGRFDFDVNANWKLVVQNTIEFDHVYSVHPTTFGSLVTAPAELNSMEMPLPHVGYQATLLPWNPTRAVEKRIEGLLAGSPIKTSNVHEHLAIFPLMAIGVFRRMSIAILRYVANGPAQTHIETRLFFPKLEGLGDSERLLLTAYGDVMLEFSKKLGHEDKLICESVQRGLANATEHEGFLGHGDRLVRRFQEGYQAYMASFQAT